MTTTPPRHSLIDRLRADLGGPGLEQAERLLAEISVVSMAAWLYQPAVGWLVASAILVGAAVVAAAAIRTRDRQGWVTTMAKAELRRASGWTRSEWLRRTASDTVRKWAASVTVPSRLAFVIAATLTLASGVILARVVRPDHHNETVLTLWQVQAAIAAFAMPVLLFVIELARDDEAAARRTAEVLIRDTLAFPITATVLVLSLLVPLVGLSGRPSSGLPAAIILLAVTIALVVFAYWRVLSLLFDREQLRDKSVRLLVARLEASMDEVISLRICANVLVNRAAKSGLEYSVLGEAASNPEFAVLSPSRGGRLRDVNVHRLEQFLERLPWKALAESRAVGVDELPDSTRTGGPATTRPRALLLKLCGDLFSETSPGLLALDRSRLGDLQIPVMERDLAQVVRVSRM